MSKVQYPCFVSDAWGREFEYLARLVGQAFASCGASHGEMMAERYASDFGHDAEALLRIGRAKAAGEA